MLKQQLNCILLIDDDEPTNFLNKMLIEESGCAREVWVEQSATEALELLLQAEPGNTPELIFLDINMPAMDGWGFLERYAQSTIANKDAIIVVMLTTSFNPEDELAAREIGVIDDYRNKPLTATMLEAILRQHFPDRF